MPGVVEMRVVDTPVSMRLVSAYLLVAGYSPDCLYFRVYLELNLLRDFIVLELDLLERVVDGMIKICYGVPNVRLDVPYNRTNMEVSGGVLSGSQG